LKPISRIYNERGDIMNNNRRTVLASALAASIAVAAPMTAFAQKKIVMGFSQIGAESEWRTANTNSMKSAAAAAGIELKFSDAQQKQENQIKALRSFIAQKVDVIALTPVVESGLGHGAERDQGRQDSVDPDAIARWIRRTPLCTPRISALTLSKKAAWQAAGWWTKSKGLMKGDINVVELQGTVGSAPAIDRKKGFEEAIAGKPTHQDHPLANWRLHARQGQGSHGSLS